MLCAGNQLAKTWEPTREIEKSRNREAGHLRAPDEGLHRLTRHGLVGLVVATQSMTSAICDSGGVTLVVCSCIPSTMPFAQLSELIWLSLSTSIARIIILSAAASVSFSPRCVIVWRNSVAEMRLLSSWSKTF